MRTELYLQQSSAWQHGRSSGRCRGARIPEEIKQKAEKNDRHSDGHGNTCEETASDTGADEADAVKPTATDRLRSCAKAASYGTAR